MGRTKEERPRSGGSSRPVGISNSLANLSMSARTPDC